ncbi:hypothetical protein Y032_0003g1384 [Ancylostoma ceylanicum]|uniref:SCP domain-containing protein n=1 Tax=Ancylostoma ceylanicum TaxID=53326 RepID=A0A016VXQ2_9BILA|nr:hypothetical protein Y032_0003g1384 [Ancylostoma ceylanicum]
MVTIHSSHGNECLKRAPTLVVHHSAYIHLGAMELPVLVALLATLQFYANIATSATEFKCNNPLITDKWREEVLNLHNKLRRRLSDGKQKGSNGMLPKGGNINQLNWDCNMEMLVDEKIEKCDETTATPPVVQPDPYGAAKQMVSIKSSEECDATSKAKEILNKWWKDGAAKQDINKQVAAVDSFTQMAYAKTDGFACSYRRCGGKFFLVCFYNKSPTQGGELYGAPKNNQACDNCEKYPPNTGTEVACEDFLCQYPLTPGSPQRPLCGFVSQGRNFPRDRCPVPLLGTPFPNVSRAFQAGIPKLIKNQIDDFERGRMYLHNRREDESGYE